ncbi:class I SAM-dependent methyltransferase [Streptomyces sp. NPDC023723]|uniref:O-methyltransferase n=1 Tax=Streptomyces sp. NPDC023723 TaxID=3154323 RepID=UPI0033DEB2F7
MSTEPATSPLRDPQVQAVLERLYSQRRRPSGGGPGGGPGGGRVVRDPHDFADIGFSIHPAQGDLIYLLCRAIGATRTVEFATSLGVSTLYFAAAVRDNGGGTVIGSEIVPEKAATARRNLTEAGLADIVDLRVGDARETLRDLGGPVDFALIDGWPVSSGPTLARQVVELIAPQLRTGAMIMNDNAEPDYLDYIRDPANGFRSVSLPLKGSTELSVKVDAVTGS